MRASFVMSARLAALCSGLLFTSLPVATNAPADAGAAWAAEPPVDAKIELNSMAGLGRAIEASVKCRADIDARDVPVRQALERLGVKVSGADEELIDLKYELPATTRVFGARAARVVYAGDSGSIFYVEFPAETASLATLVGALRLKPLPRRIASHYAYFDTIRASHYLPLGVPSQDDPYPGAIIAGTEIRNGHAYVIAGCVQFDG